MHPPLAHLCLSIYLYIFLKQAVTHVVIDRYTNNCIEQTDDQQRNVGGIRDLHFVSLCIFFFFFCRKVPRRRWSWVAHSPPSSLTSPSGRSSWRQRHRRSLRKRWCSRGTSSRQPTRSQRLWGRRRLTLAVINPSRSARKIYECASVCQCWVIRHVSAHFEVMWRHYESCLVPWNGACDWLELVMMLYLRSSSFPPFASSPLTFRLFLDHLTSLWLCIEQRTAHIQYNYYYFYFFCISFFLSLRQPSAPFPPPPSLLLSSSLDWLDSSIFSLPLINQHQLLPGLLSG